MTIDLLELIKKVVNCRNIRLTVIRDGHPEMPESDKGIRKAFFEPDGMKQIMKLLYEEAQSQAVYFVKDFFDAEYCVLKVPEAERSYGDYIFIGPYRGAVMTGAQLTDLMEEKSIPREYMNELKEYYNTLPVIAEVGQWRDLCLTFGQILYGETVQATYMSQISFDSNFRPEKDVQREELSFKAVEQWYAVEAELLKAVSSGNLEIAMTQLNRFAQLRLRTRRRDSIRDTKNMLIGMNSLFRKAAEAGGVHPAHVEAVASQFVRRIEVGASERNVWDYMLEMTRKYCALVRTYSLRGHSPVIQKVVNHINLNLARDLSLKRLSVEYSVNASYLSALFKKEMGVTLTDYISQQRIRHAITLLNSTSLQIQDIASESGIYDVNYFRKLFKKVTGKTPTEYAKQVRGSRTEGVLSLAR